MLGMIIILSSKLTCTELNIQFVLYTWDGLNLRVIFWVLQILSQATRISAWPGQLRFPWQDGDLVSFKQILSPSRVELSIYRL